MIERTSIDLGSLEEAAGNAAFVMALRGRGLRDTAVLRAMEQVPRDTFAPPPHREHARRDIALPLSCGASMTAPSTVALMLAQLRIEPGILVNVNFPDCEPADVQGVAVAAQGFRNQALLSIDARVDGRGNPYFWLAFAKARFEPGHGSDLKAIAEKRISVTPLRLDLTDEPTLTRFAQAFAE